LKFLRGVAGIKGLGISNILAPDCINCTPGFVRKFHENAAAVVRISEPARVARMLDAVERGRHGSPRQPGGLLSAHVACRTVLHHAEHHDGIADRWLLGLCQLACNSTTKTADPS